MRWSVGKRLEFIEFKAYWEGHVNRTDLVKAFTISTQQASADLKRYMSLYPDAIRYDRVAKSYVPTHAFRPQILSPSAASYLLHLERMSDPKRLAAFGPSWIGSPPDAALLRLPEREVGAEVLRQIIGAIDSGHLIEIYYQSMSDMRPRWRWIRPHAFGCDGVRWHARAFCTEDACFKDFSLARTLACRNTKPSQFEPTDDADWNQVIVLELVPDPLLTEAQAQAVAAEYGMRRGRLRIEVRRALAFYALRRLGLDVPESQRPLEARRIRLVNRGEVEAVIGSRARTLAREAG